MPRNTREYMKRFANEAKNDLERSLEKLARLREMYGEIHPDYRAAVEAMGLQITHVHDMLDKFITEIM